MVSEHSNAAIAEHFRPGQRGLLVMTGQRYLVGILSVTPDRIRVSFPVRDYPLPGTRVDLEFHDDQGYTRFETEVLECSGEVGEGLVLSRAGAGVRNHHRSAWRVPAALTVELKGHVHPRRFEAQTINVSSGGMLVRTPQPLALGDNFDIRLAIPDEGSVVFLAQVAHVVDDPAGQLAGLRFVGADPAETLKLARFVMRSLRARHPEPGPRRRITDR